MEANDDKATTGNMGRSGNKSIPDGNQAAGQEGRSTTGKSVSKKKHRLGAQVRARKVAAGLVKGLSTRQAMLAAGFSESTARHSGGSNAIMERIRDQLAHELDRQIPRDEIVSTLLDMALNAEKTERILNPKTGEISEFTDTDSYARVKALELLGRFLGALSTSSHVKVEQTIDIGEVVSKARQRLERLAALPETGEPSIDAEVIDAPAEEVLSEASRPEDTGEPGWDMQEVCPGDDQTSRENSQ